MPFGLGKSDKQVKQETDPTTKEPLEDSQEAGPAGPADRGGQPEEDTPGAMAFRPAFLDSDAPGERPAATPSPKGDAFFVSVARDGEAETHRFDDPSEVQAFVEQLLEEGVPQEDVTAFSGRRVALKVTHRPTVKLVTGQDG